MPRNPCLLIMLLLAVPADAQAVYRWVDAQGTTHYTDNSASIPKGVTVFATEGEPISELGKPGPVPVRVAPAPVEAAPVALDPAVPSQAEQFWRAQFRAAREKIRSLEDQLAADRHLVEDANGLPAGLSYSCFPGWIGAVPQAVPRHGGVVVAGPQGAKAAFGPVRPSGYVHPGFGSCIQTINPLYEQARGRVETNRKALERAKEELHDLERRAAFEAVPLEWRR